MRKAFCLLSFFLTLTVFSFLYGADEEFFLREILIEGNRVTKDKYIRDLITLEEGKHYNLEKIIDEINRSREKIERTGLFQNIFFDDVVDNENHVIITLRLKEKNYFFFGPSGFISYEKNEFVADAGLYAEYRNVFGNASTVLIEFPLYEYTGISLFFEHPYGGIKETFFLEYEYSSEERAGWISIVPGAALRLRQNMYAGLDFEVNHEDFTSFILSPYYENGFHKRHSYKTKFWYYYRVSPFFGFASESSSLYGVHSELNLYRDLLLRIVYSFSAEFDYQGGSVPDNRIYNSTVRGTVFRSFQGEKLFSVQNEFHIPLPWYPKLSVVPFLDLNYIGFDSLQFLVGGGIGLHWYNKYQNPLVVEIGFGKGVMLNFQRNF